MSAHPVIHWTQGEQPHSALWRSAGEAPAPTRVIIADDTLTADAAYGWACQGTALLWRGDFQNARQMLIALAHRIDRQSRRRNRGSDTAKPAAPAEAFHLHRQAQAQRARTLGALLVVLDGSYRVEARRAPDVQDACLEAFGPTQEPSVLSLRSLLGLIGAHEWRLKGIEIGSLGGRIHPHYGVFAPIRGEYVELVAAAPLPAQAAHGVAFDIGTGTGVLAAVLARRGMQRVIATDLDPSALACAHENIARLGLADRVQVQKADLFPPGRAALVVCNPPWIPARPSSPIERGIYDPDSRMVRAFLKGLPEHLESGGEGWLLLSDLAEHLGLRSRDELLAAFKNSGLKVLGRQDIRPKHSRATDQGDPLHWARVAELTSLWRLAATTSESEQP